MSRGYSEFFEAVPSHPPYPYQSRLGTEAWPDLVEVPTTPRSTEGVRPSRENG